MKKITKKQSSGVFKNLRSRHLAIMAVMALLFFVASPFLNANLVEAAGFGEISSRSIAMSNSNTSATSTSYKVTFNPFSSSETLGGVVVEFCSGSTGTPIIGDSNCGVPTGMALGGGWGITVPGSGCGFGSCTGWTSSNLTGGSILGLAVTLTNASAQTAGSATPITFTITGVTNPSALGTFYARIITYSSASGATGYQSASVGTPVDAGGIALSTVATINIQSKVEEQLTFCMYTGAFDANGLCGGSFTTPLLLGNNKDVLLSSGPFVDTTTKYDIQTNASHGAVIVFTGVPLNDGNNDYIQNSGTGGSTGSGTGASGGTGYALAGSGNTAQFGICSWSATNGTATPANLQIAATYSGDNAVDQGSTCASQTSQTSGTGTPGGAGTADFGFNVASAKPSAGGDTLATFPAAGNYATGAVAFGANISNVTPAGIYNTSLTFIATGTF